MDGPSKFNLNDRTDNQYFDYTVVALMLGDQL